MARSRATFRSTRSNRIGDAPGACRPQRPMGDHEGMTASAPAPRTRMRFLRPFTTHVFNPISRRFAAWLPSFGLLIYQGRKSGKTYRTPMNVFRRGDSCVFALTYGSDVDWVKNVFAAGECRVRIRRHEIRLVEPELFVDPKQRAMPLLIRAFLRFNRV